MITTLETHEYKVKEIQLEVTIPLDEQDFNILNDQEIDRKLQKELNSYPVGNLENSKVSVTETGFRTYSHDTKTMSLTYKLLITTEL